MRRKTFQIIALVPRSTFRMHSVFFIKEFCPPMRPHSAGGNPMYVKHWAKLVVFAFAPRGAIESAKGYLVRSSCITTSLCLLVFLDCHDTRHDGGN